MLLVILLLFSPPVIGRFPRIPDPEPPRSPNNPFNDPKIPQPLFPHPVTPPKPVDVPGPVQQQNAVQTRMATLERMAEFREAGQKFGEELVRAIQGSSTTDVQPTGIDSNPFTPTISPNKTMNMTLYTLCVSYAQKLNDCASSVPSFYTTTNSWAQASCACYAPISSGSCAESTFNTMFDDYATSCQQFMSSNGYSSVASAMNNSLLMPSPHFCQSIGGVLGKNATTGSGLKPTLSPNVCRPAGSPERTGDGSDSMVEGQGVRHLTSDALRKAVFISISVWVFSARPVLI